MERLRRPRKRHWRDPLRSHRGTSPQFHPDARGAACASGKAPKPETRSPPFAWRARHLARDPLGAHTREDADVIGRPAVPWFSPVAQPAPVPGAGIPPTALLSRERAYELLQLDAVPASGRRLQLQSESGGRGNRADRPTNRTLGAVRSPVPIAAWLSLICAGASCQGLRGVVVVGLVHVGLVPRGPIVVMQCRRRRSVTRGAAGRAERGALDWRRAGRYRRCVRAGAHAYLGPRPGGWLPAGDMMVMGCGSRWGKLRCGRSVFRGCPRRRGGSGMPGAGRGASA